MYTVSQFSKLCGLAVKALRHYDTKGILKPSFRKVENQYHYYSDEDSRTAQVIQYLRSLEFIIMEVRDILNNNGGEDLSYILQGKISQMEANIQKEGELTQQMRERSFTQDEEYVENTYVISMATVAGQLITSIRFISRYQDLDLYILLFYKAVREGTNDKHFNPYHDEECEEAADIELRTPMREEIHHPSLACGCSEKLHVLHTTYHSGYDAPWIAYKALFAYANDQGVRTLISSRKDYVRGLGMLFRDNPNAYVTEICLPSARGESRR